MSNQGSKGLADQWRVAMENTGTEDRETAEANRFQRDAAVAGISPQDLRYVTNMEQARHMRSLRLAGLLRRIRFDELDELRLARAEAEEGRRLTLSVSREVLQKLILERMRTQTLEGIRRYQGKSDAYGRIADEYQRELESERERLLRERDDLLHNAIILSDGRMVFEGEDGNFYDEDDARLTEDDAQEAREIGDADPDRDWTTREEWQDKLEEIADLKNREYQLDRYREAKALLDDEAARLEEELNDPDSDLSQEEIRDIQRRLKEIERELDEVTPERIRRQYAEEQARVGGYALNDQNVLTSDKGNSISAQDFPDIGDAGEGATSVSRQNMVVEVADYAAYTDDSISMGDIEASDGDSSYDSYNTAMMDVEAGNIRTDFRLVDEHAVAMSRVESVESVSDAGTDNENDQALEQDDVVRDAVITRSI